MMNESKIQIDKEYIHWQNKLFNNSLRRKAKLKRIKLLLGNTTQLNCLEISAGDGVISEKLRKHGGTWTSIGINEKASESLTQFHLTNIPFFEGEKFSFADGYFDLLVIVDSLKNITDDYAFIQECHRIINNSGLVVISERKRTPFSFIGFIQKIFKITPVDYECSRNGYSKDQIYRILKDGFDVPETIYYSNALLEFIASIGDVIQKKINELPIWLLSKDLDQKKLYNYRTLNLIAKFTYPIYWFFSFFNFFPRQEMLLKSRRRKWRPRRQPKLIDGRSIAEATINTKIGSAAPF